MRLVTRFDCRTALLLLWVAVIVSVFFYMSQWALAEMRSQVCLGGSPAIVGTVEDPPPFPVVCK